MGTLQGGAGASKKQVGSRLKILYQPSIFDGWYFFYAKMRCEYGILENF